MKLTKLQRYTAYCIMLEEAGKNRQRYPGFCLLIAKNLDESETMCYDTDFSIEADFPELFGKKTVFNDAFLFNNWDERIAALKQCIIETHPDNPKNKR